MQLIAGILFLLLTVLKLKFNNRPVLKTLFFLVISFIFFYYNRSTDFVNDYSYIKHAAVIFVFVVTCIAGVFFAQRPDSIRIFVASSLVITSIIVLLGFVEVFSTPASKRLIIFEGNPIWLARACGISFLIHYHYWRDKKKVIHLVFCAISSLVLILTASEGPLFALIVTLVLSYILVQSYKRGFTIKAIIYGFVGLLCGLLLMHFGLPIDYGGREILYRMAINHITEDAYGHGLGYFSTISPLKYPHNILLEIFLELGVVYFSIFVIYSVNAFKSAFSKSLSFRGQYNHLFTALLVYSFINANVSGDLTSPKLFYIIFFFFLAYKGHVGGHWIYKPERDYKILPPSVIIK